MTSPDAPDAPGTAPAAGRGHGRAVLAVVVVAALALGALAGALLARQPTLTAAAEGSVDAGFARDMQAHHAQAVELAVLVRDRSTDEEVRTVALDILLTQQNQIGQMAGWLSTWGLPAAASDAPMAWMAGEEHAHTAGAADPDAPAGYAAMPGWVSREDLARLTAADGAEADRLFLELMIPHHEGGVAMAGYAVEHARRPQVVALARNIVTSQERELIALHAMLDARGGPLPAP
ncbi:hypothetical protein CHO01_20100 [Cellulomonas hominis]|uniref:Uncharacterized protein (DUF305 family) n=1 Tax=Cellulomonas hominis TaxID=156981 RepID=A0A511FE71_9CELL|nr:DUF305 domain-containing protein [Cellulomonas hominis]MBB5471808.1 uncharacterized protein (DUF305 family) [Cellulomonas hominis]GEL46894.1 hypothetical protein CHO01_20100 [Cellulomonas hominis]